MTYKWDKGGFDGGGRAHCVAFDPNQQGRAAFGGDVWGYYETITSGDYYYPVMWGSKLKVAAVDGDIYTRSTCFSKMRPGRKYYGIGTLAGGLGTGFWGHVEPGTVKVVKDSTTYGFGTTLAGSDASVTPRPAGRLQECDYDSVAGREYIYGLSNLGLVRALDNGGSTLTFTPLNIMTTEFGNAFKFICLTQNGSLYCGSWGNRAAATPVSGNVHLVTNPRTTPTDSVAPAPPFINDMKLIGGTLYAVGNNGWFGLVDEADGSWDQFSSNFFSGCNLTSICGVGNVLYICTGSHTAGTNKWWAKSVDGGNSWVWLTNISNIVQGTSRQWWLNPAGDGDNKGPDDVFGSNHMDCDPHDPNTWISASFRGGWSTRDGGATIQPSMNGLGGSEVSNILVNGPGDITNDDVDWHGAHTTDHYAHMTPLAVTPVGFVNSGVGPKTFFGHNYAMQTVNPPADITKDGVSIADDFFRSACLSISDYQVDADGWVYIAMFGGGILRGNPSPVVVDVIVPSDGAVLQQASITVQAREDAGLAIDHGTVQVNNSTPLSMLFNNATSQWERLVSLPQGSLTIKVTLVQLDGTQGSTTINVSNGVVANPGPTGSVLFPTEGQILTAQQLTVSCDWESLNGIDPTSVQISVDNGATWVQMDAPGVNTPGG